MGGLAQHRANLRFEQELSLSAKPEDVSLLNLTVLVGIQSQAMCWRARLFLVVYGKYTKGSCLVVFNLGGQGLYLSGTAWSMGP